jgi:glycine/D-amino acid oxidase-like deaminating enzyme
MRSVLSDARLWPQMLDRTELAELGRRDALRARDLRPDVLVVGGGIMGVTVARACVDAGAGSVLLAEAGALGGGATGGAAGLCTPEPHHGVDPPALVDLGRRSLAAWRELDERFEDGLGLVDLEWVGLLDDVREAGRRSPKAELLCEDDVARLVPGLAVPTPALHIRGQARVQPLRAVARLAATLPLVVTGLRVTSASVSGGRLRSVTSTAGTITPGVVVFATGGPPAIDGIGAMPPADLVRGHMLVTEPSPVALPGTVDPLGTPLEDGRLLVGGTLDAAASSPSVTPSTVRAMLGALGERLPALRGLRAERAWCCFRPHHPGDLPMIDRVAGTDNAWFTSGHYRTGILMAPATASSLAAWVVTGARPNCVAAFASAGGA